MFGIGTPELMVILLIALIIFGPGKLPELGGSLGRAIHNFKKALHTLETEESEPKPLSKPSTPTSTSSSEEQIH
ncbi:MAG TPA: twin-arginine translocase TatA/TatE family subunit [Candidatus Limnocylindrales bacterium]|nr:twin-arginine translocase TatA/TatE family subunit [Candidatus Limnocylindrales bacterium]